MFIYGMLIIYATFKMLSLKLWQLWQCLDENGFNVKILGSVLQLLFRQSAKSLNVQEERLATSPQMVTRLHQPHAIESEVARA